MLQFIVVGLVFGSIYALAASGLVITYVSTGVLNFAFGAFAFFIARFYYFLHVEKEWGILLPARRCASSSLAPLHGDLLLHGDLPLPAVVVAAHQGRRHHRPVGGRSRVLAEIIFGNDEIFQAPGLAPQPVSRLQVLRHRGHPRPGHRLRVRARASSCSARWSCASPRPGLSVRAMVDSEAMTSLSGSNPVAHRRRVSGSSPPCSPGLAGILAAPVIGLDSGKYTLLIAAAFAAVIAARLRSLPDRGLRRTADGRRRQPGAVLPAARQRDHRQHRPDASRSRSSSSRSSSTSSGSGRVNEEEGVGGALDRAITPNGGSRLAASADAENLYPKLNFIVPDRRCSPASASCR